MIQNINEWELFTTNIAMIRDLPLDMNALNEDIKMPNQIIQSFTLIDKYFHEEFQRITNVNLRSKWHDKDKYLLIWTLSKLIEHLGINFLEMESKGCFEMASKILSIDVDFIRTKWYGLLKWPLRKQAWTQIEDELLIKLKEKYPNDRSWIEITSEFNIQMKMVRYPKQLRERWHNVIDPNITKVVWTLEEDLILFKEAQKNKKWSRITKLMPNQRTDNQVKNRYNSVIKRLCKELDLDFNNQNVHNEIIYMINQSQSTNKEDFYKTKKLKIEDPNSSSQIIQQNLYPIFIYPYYYYYRF